MKEFMLMKFFDQGNQLGRSEASLRHGGDESDSSLIQAQVAFHAYLGLWVMSVPACVILGPVGCAGTPQVLVGTG